MLAAVLVVGAAVLAFAMSPRHRAFYLGGGDGGREAEPGPSVAAPAPPPTASGGKDGAKGTTEPLRIAVADRVPRVLPAAGVPRGWDLREFTGRADVDLVRDDRLAIRLRSERTSYLLHRDVVVDLRERPLLTWSWKAMRLPATGDGRVRATDDAVGQIYVVFPRWPDPRTASDVIGYVWDSTAPRGATFASPRAENVRVVVVESGPARLDRWLEYQRNVAQDYVALFGREPPRVGKVALMIDSNDTRSGAEVLIGDLMFSPRT